MSSPDPNKNKQNKKDQQVRKSLAQTLFWGLMLGLLLYSLFGLFQGSQQQSISYTQFRKDVSEGKVAQITMKGHQVTGTFKETAKEKKEKKPAETFTTMLPPISDPELMGFLEKSNVTINAQPQTSSVWMEALVGFLPWILLIGIFVYIGHRMQQQMAGGGGGGIFQFGKSKAKRFRKGPSDVTFQDVAGLENAKRDLEEIIDYLKDPERYRKVGAKLPRGVLLMGPPGTGKTLLAKAVAGEADVPFYSTSGSEFVEMFVGVGASRVRDMFENAKKEAPAVIFIDEIDSVGRARGTGIGGGHDEREQTLNQILSEMDGFAPGLAVIVMAATNRPDVLDPALLRPGRFDRKIAMELPRKEARRKILEVHVRKVHLAEDVDLDIIARRTAGFSGADLENLINEAALLSARERKEKVDMDILERARDKIVLGAERETLLDENEKRRVAYHESGHALLACLLPHTDPLDKVTIIPRGLALGVTEQLPEEERYNLTESYLKDRITVMLGGRVSEKLVFDEMSSGAENDLQQATNLARRMISRWGMSKKIGPVAFRRDEDHIFLGREMAQPPDFSEHTAQLIDDEVRALISGLEEKATKVLQEQRAQLDVLAKALIERESLDVAEVRELVACRPDEVEAGTES